MYCNLPWFASERESEVKGPGLPGKDMIEAKLREIYQQGSTSSIALYIEDRRYEVKEFAETMQELVSRTLAAIKQVEILSSLAIEWPW